MSNLSPAQLATRQKYREKNRELIAQKAREYYKLHPERKAKPPKGYSRKYHYPAKYGITLEQFVHMEVTQDYKCAICGKEENTRNKQGEIASLCVDHNHSTGEVRGLLCRLCNSALGKFQDSVDILEKAKLYLLQYGNDKNHDPA